MGVDDERGSISGAGIVNWVLLGDGLLQPELLLAKCLLVDIGDVIVHVDIRRY